LGAYPEHGQAAVADRGGGNIIKGLRISSPVRSFYGQIHCLGNCTDSSISSILLDPDSVYPKLRLG
jgi:hypothetical protein